MNIKGFILVKIREKLVRMGIILSHINPIIQVKPLFLTI